MVTGQQSLFRSCLKDSEAPTRTDKAGLLATPQFLYGLVEVTQSLVGPCESF